MANFKRRRAVCVGTDLVQTIGLGAPYAQVVGYNILSSVDTSVSAAIVDADGKTIATIASGDYTNTTLKDGVEFTLSPEGPTGRGVTEDGTDAVANKVAGGVWARSPITITAAGLDSAETATIDLYVKTNVKKRTVTLVDPEVATELKLGAKYGRIVGANVLSSADTSAAVTISDAEGKVVFTLASGDYTNTTGKDGVEFTLSPEGPTGRGVTEDGTDSTANEMGLGVWAMSPLSLLHSGIDTGETLTVDVYVEV
jgi:hypothetical protein